MLLLEAIPERFGARRTRSDWMSIGRTLAAMHQVRAQKYGLDSFDGFFGPFPQPNSPVGSGISWTKFYAERRVLPRLRGAIDSGHLPTDIAVHVDRLVEKLPALGGQDPGPALLHGDAQQNNFLSHAGGTMVIDAAPYFGHPEFDLALVDFSNPFQHPS